MELIKSERNCCDTLLEYFNYSIDWFSAPMLDGLYIFALTKIIQVIQPSHHLNESI